MMDGNENDYRFFAEENENEPDAKNIAENQPEHIVNAPAKNIEHPDETNESFDKAANIEPENTANPCSSGNSEEAEGISTQNTFLPLQNSPVPKSAVKADEYSTALSVGDFAETQNASHKSFENYTDTTSALNAQITTAYREETDRKKKNNRFGMLLRRSVGFLCAAALFGGVAAGAFIGFNELYYYLNPASKPSITDNVQTPGGDRNTQPLISHTAVASGTSVATADVSDIVLNAMPSLVSISCTFRNTTSFFGYLYEGTSEGAGSGIIVGKNDTELLIATNNHVVDGAITVTVTFLDGSQVSASVRGTEETADLAIVSVPLADISAETLEGITIASLGNSDDAKVGQMVIAIGNALGYGQTTTVGYLSAKEREITISDSTTGKTTKYIALQVDAAINPGNSGGALLNTEGKVIGINSAKLSNTKVEGIGYAIPINDAINILDELMNREILTEEEQGYLGVYLSDQEITSEISRLYGFPSGVFISNTVKGGAADQAGIVPGDIITKINGSAVTVRTQLQEKVKSYRSGTSIEVTLARLENGKYIERNVTVVLGSKADFN